MSNEQLSSDFCLLSSEFGDRAHKMYFLCKTNPMSSHQKINLTDYIIRSYVVFGHLVNETNKPKQTQSWRGHPGRAVTGPWPVTTSGCPSPIRTSSSLKARVWSMVIHLFTRSGHDFPTVSPNPLKLVCPSHLYAVKAA